jgi:hypothetical protein
MTRVLLLSLGLAFAACSPSSSPPKSPTNDVTPPTTDPGTGDIMGADKVSPGEKLEQGPKLDSEKGFDPAKEPAEK